MRDQSDQCCLYLFEPSMWRQLPSNDRTDSAARSVGSSQMRRGPAFKRTLPCNTACMHTMITCENQPVHARRPAANDLDNKLVVAGLVGEISSSMARLGQRCRLSFSVWLAESGADSNDTRFCHPLGQPPKVAGIQPSTSAAARGSRCETKGLTPSQKGT